MQIVLHADKNREYEYAVDGGCSKEITIKKRTTLRVPDGSSTLVFRQAGFYKKQNIFFLALISFVLAFLESQDHEDKGYFASFYNFANGCFVADFDVELKSAQADDLEIYSEQIRSDKFAYTVWKSETCHVDNKTPRKALWDSFVQLSCFWSSVFIIPTAAALICTVIAYIRTHQVWDLGIALSALFILTFMLLMIAFTVQYKCVRKQMDKVEQDGADDGARYTE